jgi:hypothetical protein
MTKKRKRPKREFNPDLPVSKSNPWPLCDYPIPKGSLVFVRVSDWEIVTGKVVWYNPARSVDPIVQTGPYYVIAFEDRPVATAISSHVWPVTSHGVHHLCSSMTSTWFSKLWEMSTRHDEESRKIMGELSRWQHLTRSLINEQMNKPPKVTDKQLTLLRACFKKEQGCPATNKDAVALVKKGLCEWSNGKLKITPQGANMPLVRI